MMIFIEDIFGDKNSKHKCTVHFTSVWLYWNKNYLLFWNKTSEAVAPLACICIPRDLWARAVTTKPFNTAELSFFKRKKQQNRIIWNSNQMDLIKFIFLVNSIHVNYRQWQSSCFQYCYMNCSKKILTPRLGENPLQMLKDPNHSIIPEKYSACC